MGRKSKVKGKYDFECFAYVQSLKHSNWISESFFSHSLNDKSLQVTEIHDLNNEKENI